MQLTRLLGGVKRYESARWPSKLKSGEYLVWRKLTLTVVVVLSVAVVGVAATGQAAQASSKHQVKSSFLIHPSYIVRGLLCIHHWEGSWTDPGGPYWGGLQEDISFQTTYGYFGKGRHRYSFLRKWGTADHWPMWAQVVSGIHAYFSRGWAPWPNTARMCGL